MRIRTISISFAKVLPFFLLMMWMMLIASIPAVVQAGGPGTPAGGSGGVTLDNPIKANSLPEFLEQILTVVIQIGYLVAVFFFVYTGFKFVMAQGNDSEITSAKNMLLWTVIGTAILIGAHVISAAIKATVDSLSA